MPRRECPLPTQLGRFRARQQGLLGGMGSHSRREGTTGGTLDRSTPAKVSAAQRAPARFTPITIKCESSIDHPTAIRRQFAPSSPCSHGSISSRRGKRPPSAEVDPENETVG